MIVVEDKLEEIFSYIPKMSYEVGGVEFNVVFGYGDKYELNQFLKDNESNDNKPYPLIWMLYPYKELHKKKVVDLKDIVLILATNTNASMSNKDRIKTNFKRILIPLYDYVFTVLQRAVNISLLEEVEVIKFPNFSSDKLEDREESFTIELWDALKTVWNFNINNSCLKDIKVNNKVNTDIDITEVNALNSNGGIIKID